MAQQRRAITHADLEPNPSNTELGSRTGVVLIVLTILVGVFCFVLCLFSEATRSQVTWITSNNKDGESYQCVYSGSGKTPFLCAAIAFIGLAAAVVIEHMYMLIAISKSPPPVLLTWDTNSAPAKFLTWTAGFFFVTSWISFAVGEILLLIAITVESGHLRNWSKPKPNCLAIKEGLLSAAGVFSLLTVSLAAGLYLTALHAQRVSKEHEILRREIFYAAALYATPPRSPPLQPIAVTRREDPVGGDNDMIHEAMSFGNTPGFREYLKYVV